MVFTPVYNETWAGGVDGAAMTTGGDVFSVTATTVYSAADTITGHSGIGVRTSGATGAGPRVSKGSIGNTHTGSLYFKLDTLSAGAIRLITFQTSANQSTPGAIRANSSGHFDIANAAGTLAAGSQSLTVPTTGNTYRLDWQFDQSVAGTSTITYKIFTNPEGDPSAPDEVVGPISFTGAGVFAQWSIGQPGNVANVLGFHDFRVADGLADWPTAVNPGAPPPPTAGVSVWNWVGAPSSTGFVVTALTSSGTSLALRVATDSAMSSVVLTTAAQARNASSGLNKFEVTGLATYTQYWYQLVDTPAGGVETPIGEIGKARTLPGTGPQNFKFAFGGCVTNNSDAHVALDNIRTYDPDWFMHMGDFHYYNPTATDLGSHVALWEQQIQGANGYHNLIRDVPMFYVRSDHDAGPGDNADSDVPSNQASIDGYKTIVPFPASGFLADGRNPTVGLYFTYVVGRCRFIHIDIRNMDRSPGLSTDGPTKTMLGAQQLQWLKDQLLMPEPLKFIVSDVAWSGPPSTANGEDKWWSYDNERQQITDFITANNVKIIMLTSDTHSLLSDNGALNGWGGFPIFGSAPMYNVGGGRNLTYYTNVYNTTTSVIGQQYSRVEVTDDGNTITVTNRGWDAITNTQKITDTVTFDSASSALVWTVVIGGVEQPVDLSIVVGGAEQAVTFDRPAGV